MSSLAQVPWRGEVSRFVKRAIRQISNSFSCVCFDPMFRTRCAATYDTMWTVRRLHTLKKKKSKDSCLTVPSLQTCLLHVSFTWGWSALKLKVLICCHVNEFCLTAEWFLQLNSVSSEPNFGRKAVSSGKNLLWLSWQALPRMSKAVVAIRGLLIWNDGCVTGRHGFSQHWRPWRWIFWGGILVVQLGVWRARVLVRFHGFILRREDDAFVLLRLKRTPLASVMLHFVWSAGVGGTVLSPALQIQHNINKAPSEGSCYWIPLQETFFFDSPLWLEAADLCYLYRKQTIAD